MEEAVIGINIKELLQQNNVTLEKLTATTNLTKGYLSQIEKSKKAPPFSTLNKIAQAIGLDISMLLHKRTMKSTRTMSPIVVTKKRGQKAGRYRRLPVWLYL